MARGRPKRTNNKAIGNVQKLIDDVLKNLGTGKASTPVNEARNTAEVWPLLPVRGSENTTPVNLSGPKTTNKELNSASGMNNSNARVVEVKSAVDVGAQKKLDLGKESQTKTHQVSMVEEVNNTTAEALKKPELGTGSWAKLVVGNKFVARGMGLTYVAPKI